MYLGASCALNGNAEFPFGYMGSKYAVGGRCTQNNPTSFLSVFTATNRTVTMRAREGVRGRSALDQSIVGRSVDLRR
jgi:hypothetical protein